MGRLLTKGIKSVDDEDDQEMLPLIFTHTYDTVEITTLVPWEELHEKTQRLALKVVDYYRMQASIKVDANVTIRQLNITSHDPDEGMAYSLIAVVEAVGDNDIDDVDIEALFEDGYEEDDDDE